ncbi:NAD(+) diphosphatase [Sphingomonas sp. FW199]|uniref:NAD(+) diphosphatase n=1 Tax=Sphingomonas sp. FW199 TaxID=3400217 RepID=UPI003CF70C13
MPQPGFSGGWLDRADALRQQPDRVAAMLADPASRLLRLTALEPELDGAGRLVWDGIAALAADARPLLLGINDGIAHFAAVRADDPAAFGRSPTLTALLGEMRHEEAAVYAVARSLTDWHRRHGFCANCGQATDMARAGWMRACSGCGAEHYPRTDPVVIMLAERGDRVLLGRQPSWPPGRWSALAGFVEVGETIEEAVRRETMEEAGISIGPVRYIASQPWPFPSSLMIACIGKALDEAITIDANELEQARWFTRDEVSAALAGAADAAFIPAPPYAIAHTLMTAWLAGA